MRHFKPKPGGGASTLPLATPACEVVQAIGGAELNVAVALSRISSSPHSASFVSVLPDGALGKQIIDAAASAGVDTADVHISRTPNAAVGTLHVVDEGSGPRPHYQRHHSAFCASLSAEGALFNWADLLHAAKWLHVTGITPLLGDGPKAEWDAAISAARAAPACQVVLDFNHRPALGTLEELWAAVAPHLASGAVSLLMLSEDSLRKVSEKEGIQWDENATAEAVHAQQRAAMSALRAKLGVRMLGCGFKRAAATNDGGSGNGTGDSTPSGTRNKDTLKGGAGVVRWSVVATDEGLVSTEGTPTRHKPLEALGGGDAWVGGFLHSMLEAGSTADGAAVARACRRGDILAALSMARYGDLSDVSAGAVQAAERTWVGKTAELSNDDVFATASAAAVERLGASRLVPVVAIDEPSAAEPVARALLAGGLNVMELVLRTPAAEEALAIIAERVPEMYVGAGTVLSVAQAERSVTSGARFLVSPGTNPAVVRWATQRGVPIVPGVATATEIEAAMALGLTHLKFFPAEANGGAATLKALSGPYGKLKFMPTGGVTEKNMPSYLGLPSVFCVGGTWLVPAKAVQEKDWGAIEALTKAAVAALPP